MQQPLADHARGEKADQVQRDQGEQAGAGYSGGHEADADQERLQRRDADDAFRHRPDGRAGELAAGVRLH